MEEYLNDREVALILTVVNLLGQRPNPTMVQQAYREAKLAVEEARTHPESYPLFRGRRNS
jgi:hypothetical protein